MIPSFPASVNLFLCAKEKQTYFVNKRSGTFAEWLLYFLIVRAVRLADSKSQE